MFGCQVVIKTRPTPSSNQLATVSFTAPATLGQLAAPEPDRAPPKVRPSQKQSTVEPLVHSPQETRIAVVLGGKAAVSGCVRGSLCRRLLPAASVLFGFRKSDVIV